MSVLLAAETDAAENVLAIPLPARLSGPAILDPMPLEDANESIAEMPLQTESGPLDNTAGKLW